MDPIREQQRRVMISLGIGDFDPGDIVGVEGQLKQYVANNSEGKAGLSQSRGKL